ncbi:MAG: bifunctional 5,10-methylenetetrahydrofolate dehydrogenase/5,10-methenyltetrahydrofolate cyclohydrolase [Phycisphaerae bacterium]|nr:bifunctional 5,10-methylenetetrahydrofolate dehydrogenase/5,10-methenyltetrahydrofolate cyclohydrolase [Phycisphaerae bacterium]
MPSEIIDGKAVAAEIKQQVAVEAETLRQAHHPPSLVAVQVGDDPASELYTNMQRRNCAAVGINYQLLNLFGDISQHGLLQQIDTLNRSDTVDGIVLQLPLPAHIDTRAAQMEIDPAKDVEGVHPENMGRLFYGGWVTADCTPMAAVELLRRVREDMSGLEAVVIGHSAIVGKPLAMLLLQSIDRSPTVTICHVATRDLTAHTRQADIVVAATGVRQMRWLRYKHDRAAGKSPERPDLSPLITSDMIKPGATVIDVAINRIPVGFDDTGEPLRDDEGKVWLQTVGDVDFDACRAVAGAITPVPGGVGPVTVAMLLRNTIACAEGWG